MAEDLSIVYLVAGLSSRFGEIKSLADVGLNGESFIECSIKQALKSGFNKIIFVVGEKNEKKFKEIFGNEYGSIPIEYAVQIFDKEKRDVPWGTADALYSAEKITKTPFIVCTADDLYGENSFKRLSQHLIKGEGEACIGHKLIDTLPDKGSVNRAIFNIEGDYVKDIGIDFSASRNTILKQDEEKLSCMTIFALNLKTIFLIRQILEKFKEEHKEDRKIELKLHTALSELIKKRKIKMKIYPAVDKWIGLTNPEDKEIVRKFIKNKL